MTTSNVAPGDALAVMRARWRAGTTDFPRLCLRHVRTAYQIPAKYPTAGEARKHVTNFHKYNGNPESIPYGAFVFSRHVPTAEGDPEHVFLAGGHAGTGKKKRRIFWTNDSHTLGGTAPVALKFFTEHWGHEILGWSDNINGVSINVAKVEVPARKTVKKSTAKKSGKAAK